MSLLTAGYRLLSHRLGLLLARLRRASPQADPPYAGIIREATACLDSPDRATAFREADGLSRLQSAIEAAEADDNPELARAGRQALQTLQSTAVRGSDIPPEE